MKEHLGDLDSNGYLIGCLHNYGGWPQLSLYMWMGWHMEIGLQSLLDLYSWWNVFLFLMIIPPFIQPINNISFQIITSFHTPCFCLAYNQLCSTHTQYNLFSYWFSSRALALSSSLRTVLPYLQHFNYYEFTFWGLKPRVLQLFHKIIFSPNCTSWTLVLCYFSIAILRES